MRGSSILLNAIFLIIVIIAVEKLDGFSAASNNFAESRAGCKLGASFSHPYLYKLLYVWRWVGLLRNSCLSKLHFFVWWSVRRLADEESGQKKYRKVSADQYKIIAGRSDIQRVLISIAFSHFTNHKKKTIYELAIAVSWAQLWATAMSTYSETACSATIPSRCWRSWKG
jgi:hypothetical protein